MTSVATVHAHDDPESLGVEVVGYVDEVKRSVARGETLNISMYDPQNDKSSFVHTQIIWGRAPGQRSSTPYKLRGGHATMLLGVHMAATNI